jgi:hypothetical protein
MSLDRFIYCVCTHPLDAHANRGCTRCVCPAAARDVIDRLLEVEREAIHRTWLGRGTTDAAADSVRAAG